MPTTFPYIISNNKIEPILARIRAAARPPKFSRETLTTWGFTASNDRAMVGILRDLGFVTDAGVPTEYYDSLRDASNWKYVLAERMRDLYKDLFAIDANIQKAPESEIKGAISRISGKDDETVKRYYATFRTLASLALFDAKPNKGAQGQAEEQVVEKPNQKKEESIRDERPIRHRSEYHYNIQIHLPVTTDVTVYNAIFKSLRENLDI